MSIQDQIEQKKAELAVLEEKLQAVAPHLSALAEIESFADRLVEGARTDFAAVVKKAKDLF